MDWKPITLGALIVGGLWWFIAARKLEVAAWTGFAAITNPGETIRLAKRAGVTRLAIFVNSEPEPGRAFYTYNRQQIASACAAFKAAGLDITIVSWMTPRGDWLEGAATIGDIAREVGADEVEYDLEEEWTALRSKSDDHIRGATRTVFAQTRSRFSGAVVVDFIVYTDLRVMTPAIELADAIIPQAYATVKNAGTRPPGELERIAYDRFKPFGKPIIMGVAGWNQDGAYGRGYLDALRVSLDAATALGIRRVRVWRLETIDAQEGQELIAWKARATKRTEAA